MKRKFDAKGNLKSIELSKIEQRKLARDNLKLIMRQKHGKR